MPRPSMKETRTTQILDAVEVAVARYGVEGTTLERIAEEAGMARALIRHNVGNRDDLIEAMTDRFLEKSTDEMTQMVAELPKENTLATMVDWLFDETYSNTHVILLADALGLAAANDRDMARKMRLWTQDFIDQITDVIISSYPNTDEKTANAVAAGITGIYFNVESHTPLGPMTTLREASKDAALLLIRALEIGS